MHVFFLDPTRSRYLYSTSLVIDECQKTIEHHIPGPAPYPYYGLVHFFTLTPKLSGEIPIGNIANATYLLESARNGSDRRRLLLFLEYLSEINWFDIYHRGWEQRHLTNRIAYWVCTTLVG